MALLDTLIVASCVGLSGQANQACEKALQAGSQQSGVQQTTNTYETHQLKLLENAAYDWFGHDAVMVVGGAGWLTKSIVDKKASFGIYGPVSTELSNNMAKLVLKWTW